MTVEIPKWIILAFVSGFFMLPLFLVNIFQNGSFASYATEPFLSRQTLVTALQFFVVAIVFGIGGYYIFASIMAGLGLLLLINALWCLRKYNKSQKLAQELKT